MSIVKRDNRTVQLLNHALWCQSRKVWNEERGVLKGDRLKVEQQKSLPAPVHGRCGGPVQYKWIRGVEWVGTGELMRI